MLRKAAGGLASALLVLVCYPFARSPELTVEAEAALASRFRFERYPIAEPLGHPPHRNVREVHPSLERISAWVSSLGAGASLADLDGDGLPNDLVLVDPRTDQVSISPVPGSGERYAPFALDDQAWSGGSYGPGSVAPTGALAGDFDEDGALDVLVYFWGRTPLLYLRRDPALDARAFAARELVDSGERWYSNAALQADLDGDGHLDLLIAGYFQDGARILDARASGRVVLHEGKARALNGGHEHFLLARVEAGAGGVRYEEIRDVLAEEVSGGWTLALAAADLDGDLLPELYLANDFGPDRLLHNRSTPGRLSFAVLEGERDFLTPKSCVLGHDSFKGMGVDFGDVDGDGLLDIYVSNLATRFGLTESHFLWLNTGELSRMKDGVAPFVHASEKLGLARSGFAWDARLADFDNDGTPEAVQGCGFIRGRIDRWPELQALGTSNDRIVHDPRFWPAFQPGADLSGDDSNPFFVLGDDGRYHDLAPVLGLDEPAVTRGIAIGDVDGDGRLDFVTANQWGPSYFFKNASPARDRFLGLRLVHAGGTRAVGANARVELSDGRVLVAQVDGGNGHSGHRSPDLHFGLGERDAGDPVSVALAWRDRDGIVRRSDVRLRPGWHDLVLPDGEDPILARPGR